MAEFYSAVTTDSGLALSADLLTGEQIVFTKLVVGSGIYTNEETSRSRLQTATQIKDEKQEFEISSITKETDNCILLKTLISNKELTEGYRITEIGIYAKKQGESTEEILYSISIAKEADFLPCYNGIAPVEIIEEYYITVSNAAEISLQVSGGASVLREDLDKIIKEIREEVNQKIIDLQSQIGDLPNLITEDKGCLVNAINEIAEVIKPFTDYSLATDIDIHDIIDGIYQDDLDWITSLEVAAGRDIESIIKEEYIDIDEDEKEGYATNQDILDIVAGTYENEEESGEIIL